MSTRPEPRRRGVLPAVAVTLILGLAVLAGGCSRPLSPGEVADRFWRAVVTQSSAKIRRYVRAADRESLQGDPDVLPVSAYALGRIVIDGEAATVETDVTLDADEPLNVKIDTVLVREAGHWRVDYAATVNRISMQSELARVIGQIESFGETLKQGIDKSVDELQQAVPEIERQLSRIEEGIRQRMPELRQKLEEFSRRLEESLEKGLERGPEATPPAEEPGEPIAI